MIRGSCGPFPPHFFDELDRSGFVVDHPIENDGLRHVEPTVNSSEAIRLGRSRGAWIGWGLLAGGLALGVGTIAVAIQKSRSHAARSESVRDLALQPVSRVDFQSKMTAAGRVESHQNTVVLCQIERLSISNEGRTVSASGAAQVLEVIEEGKRVKKEDILCRLSSTDYEEMVRTQLMKTEQAGAALEQAQLSFDVAELAVSEYRDGLRRQSVQEMEGQIALAESDLERATDRLRWTKNMLVKGYVPVAQRATAERTVAQLRLKLATGRSDLDNFTKYGNPRVLKELMAEVEKRRYEVTANTQRVSRLQERLAHYRKMVDFCTIRAPHDGLLIYSIDPNRRNAPRLEPGVEVRQQQQLFQIPDLDQMEVITYLHESVAQKVAVGLSAWVQIEGLGNRTLPGKVVSVGPLPVSSPAWTTSEEVKYFIATVKLDQSPTGLLPGMSAEVEIDLDRSQDVLAVPSEAVAIEQGRDICYVAGLDGLERRQVTVGRSNRNLLEVTGGLAEGEEVVINPAHVEQIDSLLVHSEEAAKEPADPAPAEPGSHGSGPVGVE